MSNRPLVFVSGLTVGDYLLWNWSLGGNHEVIALVAGLTLPPLALALLWLAVVAVARLLARSASWGLAPAVRRPWSSRRAAGRARGSDGGVALEQPSVPSAPTESPRKIAA